MLNAYVRQSASPQTVLTPVQTANFGTSAQVHEFLFTAPANQSAASFMIEVQQASGTVYIDDIQFYEADATLLDIDDQLKFEYNPTNAVETISLDAKYIGIDNTIYNGSITLQPFTSKILLKNGNVTGTLQKVALTSSVSAPAISCFGSSTTATVTSVGGVAPYSGTGTFTVNAGTGSLKISVPSPVADAYTLLYSTIGAVSSSKNYVLRFTTLGTTNNGALKVYLRQTDAPYGTLTPIQYTSFGTSRIDHQFIFTAPSSQAAASFTIEVLQSSGTTYIDNIAFFEATSTGALLSNNLYPNGQFESSISNITAWSATNNHIASLDLTSKITNTYYYTVKDATGAMATAALTTTQPAAALQATATAGNITSTGGSTTVVVQATGGTAPYTGAGSFTGVKAGTYNYTVKDAGGCTSVTTITVKQISSGRVNDNQQINGTDSLSAFTTTGDSATAKQLSSLNNINSTALKINSYPNPTTTEFGLMVAGGTNEILNIAVFSMDGRVVFKTQGSSNNRYTFGNNFIPGMYIIQVIQGSTMQTLKVIKAK